MTANFIPLDTLEKLNLLIEDSHAKPVVLFKHSNACGISSGVYRDVSQLRAEINLIVVQASRNVSDRVVELTGVRHETPQAIVLRNGVPVYSASHYDITLDGIEAGLRS